MAKLARGKNGRFVAKSNENREVRSLRLTDKAWKALGIIAESQSITRADLIENLIVQEQLSEHNRVSLKQIEEAITQLLDDPQITRDDTDKRSIRCALETLLKLLS
jgi:hypothetical protein